MNYKIKATIKKASKYFRTANILTELLHAFRVIIHVVRYTRERVIDYSARVSI